MKNICNLCPRACKIDKKKNSGFCKTNGKILINKVMLHYFEEPCISGNNTTNGTGSGAIFFAGCNLRCIYCQNYEISHYPNGKEYTTQELANVFKYLEEKGAVNINLVTPTHFADKILETLKIYTPSIPIVWNSSGYENPNMIKKIVKKVQVFLYDFKYYSNEIAKKYSACDNYFENCTKCLKIIKKVHPKNVYQGGLLKDGLIIRHMVLPGYYKDSMNILTWIKNRLGNDTAISLLAQYTPCGECWQYPEINRKLKPIEYKKVTSYAEKLGFENGFVQELSSSSTCFIPEFEKSTDIYIKTTNNKNK